MSEATKILVIGSKRLYLPVNTLAECKLAV